MPQKTYYSIDTELLKKFKISLEKSTIDSSEIKFNDIKNVINRSKKNGVEKLLTILQLIG